MHAIPKFHSDVGFACRGRLEFDHDGPCDEDPTQFCKHFVCLECEASVAVRCPQSRRTLKAIHLLDATQQAR